MRGDRGLFAVMITLVVLSLIAFGLVSLGSTSNEVLPSTLSSNPGGALALFELLQQSGVPVERAYAPLRGNRRDDIGLVIVFDRYRDAELSFLNESSDAMHADISGVPICIHAPVEMTLPRRKDAESVPVRSPYPALGSTREVVIPGKLDAVVGEIPLLTSDLGRSIVYAEIGNDRLDIHLSNGFVLLNRFIGQGDNAEMIVTLVRSLLPKNKKVLFPEYLYGIKSPDNLFTRLGPSFSSVLIQLMFIFVLLVYTLGKRFGYPEVDVPAKPGASDFVEAVAEAFKRGKCTDVVLQAELKRALREVSRKMGFSAQLSDEERLKRIPAPLGATMREMYIRREEKLKPAQSAELVARLNRQLSEFRGMQL